MDVKRIFRAYDIRGLYPEELDESLVASIAAAFLEFLMKKGAVNFCLLGRDRRWSSEEIQEAVAAELIKRGVEVWDLGVVTTPLFTFAMASARSPAGIMITASHNSPRYNGFKLYEGVKTLSEKTGLREIKELVEKGISRGTEKRRGFLQKKDFREDYVNFLTSRVSISREVQAVFDAGSGAVSAVLPGLLKKINIASLLKDKAEVAFIFDADGDRVTVLDEKGIALRGDAVLWLLAKGLKSGEKVVYDLRSSHALVEDLEAAGLFLEASRVGHSFVKEAMREAEAALGGELSGHFYFRGFFYAESALLAALKILEILSKEKAPLSELVRPFSRYFHSGEINLKTPRPEAILEELERRYEGGEKNRLDGLTVEFPGFWFNLRPSNTEPLLRLVLEAKDKKTFEEKKEELTEFLMRLGVRPAL